MQNLDLWLEFVDTTETMPLFERKAKEYSILKLTNVDWSSEPDYLFHTVQERKFTELKSFKLEE
jgi:hypothetical protein